MEKTLLNIIYYLGVASFIIGVIYFLVKYH